MKRPNGSWRPEDLVEIRPCEGMQHKTCQFIEGDPIPEDGDHDSIFCGKPVKPGSPYCLEHHKRCFTKRTKPTGQFVHSWANPNRPKDAA